MGPTIPLAGEGNRDARTERGRCLTKAGAFLVTHEGVPLPGSENRPQILQIPVAGRARGERIAELERIADAMGVAVTSPRDPVTGREYGALEARVDLGDVHLVAHVGPEGSRHLTDRQDELHLRLVRADADTCALYAAALDEADLQLAEEAHATVVIAEAGIEEAA
jgi:hypothetical protein